MAERTIERQVETLKTPVDVLEAVLADPEFETAVEYMLSETGEYDAIVSAMADVAERHGASVDDINTAIRMRFIAAGHEFEQVPSAR